MAYMDTGRGSTTADPHRPLGPGPHTHHAPYPHQPIHTSAPASLPPLSTFHSQQTSNPHYPPLHPPGPPGQQPAPSHYAQAHPPGPPGSAGPPPQYPPPTHRDAQERVEHGYHAPQSGHNTPVIRQQSEASYQRTPSTPGQPQAPPPSDRPPMTEVAPPPVYAPPPHSLPGPPPPEQQHHAMNYGALMPPPGAMVIDHRSGYSHPPPGVSYAPYPPMYHQPMVQNQASRKKSVRASQACDKCRERKSKCDEQRPCSTCKDQNIECHYKDSQPTKTDKSNAALADVLDKILEKVETMEDRLSRMKHFGPLPESKTGHTSHDQDRSDTPAFNQTSEQLKQELRRASIDEPLDFAEHSTSAHKLLLLWPSIEPLIKHRPGDNYVIQEEDRGPLRLYGPGERVFDDSVALGAASPAHSTGSDEFSGSPLDGSSNGFANHDTEPRRSEPTFALPADAALMMDPATLTRLFDSYKRHIHRLHPFLDTESFGRYIRWFITKYSHENVKYPYSPMFATNGDRNYLKRKRSEGFAAGFPPMPETGMYSQVPRRQPDRTVINAIVYLVFALGKVCEAKEPIPGPLAEAPARVGHTTSFTGASPAMKPVASPQSASVSFPPPGGDLRSGFESRGSSFESSPGADKRHGQNVDKIPGLAYYREACSILGDFADHNDLACAQARLLAGLYKGQLGRVQESWSWIHNASRTCQYRIKIENLTTPDALIDKQKNLTLLATWTCLQLESDILAELDYPHSGLLAFEEMMPYPRNVMDDEAAQQITPEGATGLERINIYYSAQLFLRKQLNRINFRLYGTDLAKQDPRTLSARLVEQDSTLDFWRNLPSIARWHDDEPPQADILAARLRAKYYGARYVTNRPFLDYALHVMDGIHHGRRLEDLTRDSRGRQRSNELALFQAIAMMPEDQIREKVVTCIECAMQSTVAFDGVSDHRLIVTNIMGTAHAQFGNMLVLSATYSSKQQWLSSLVPKEKLEQLLRRTIKFLRKLEHASKTARVDITILEDLEKRLFPDTVYDSEMHTGDSFSSH